MARIAALGSCVAAGLALGAVPAGAKSISLQLTAQARVEGGTLAADLTVRNVGDEAGHSLSPVLHFRDEQVRGQGIPRLDPNQSVEIALALPTGGLAPGRWPYRIAVDYADANQYPFHALHAAAVVVGAPPPAKLAVVEVTPAQLATRGSLTVRVKNLSAAERSVRVSVQLPESLEVSEPLSALELGGFEQRSVKVPIVNRMALPGSRYAIFVSAEYDEQDVHQAVVVPGVVEIVAPRSLFERHGLLLWGAAALVLLVWAAVIMGRRLARRR